jgi:ABC-2 type transport system ATP-binding protein
VIDVDMLEKWYGARRALAGISFHVPKGQVVGFLGPNGAGKTTTMKILTGYLAPDAGTARVAGFDMTSDPIPGLRRIGYLPAGNPQYADLRVVEALRFAAELHGLRGSARDEAVDAAIAAVGLEDRRSQTTGTLSTGYRQRVGLARALLHRPDVLILDEPTSGLDPNQQMEMRQLVRSLGSERTVILSTHILPEVEAVCDRAIIIHEGTIVADGSIEAIRGGRSRGVVATLRATPTQAEAALAGLPQVSAVQTTPVENAPGYVTVRVVGPTDRDACARVAAAAASAGLGVAALHAEAATLEQIFAELTSHAPTETAHA